jgi:hypothetical protein
MSLHSDMSIDSPERANLLRSILGVRIKGGVGCVNIV